MITSDDLYEYGKWARDNPDCLAPKSQWHDLIMRGNVEQVTSISYIMDDDTAMQIDKAVCQLCKHNTRLSQVFYQHYVLGLSYRALAKEYDTSRNTIDRQLCEASGFVLGVACSGINP